MEHKYTFLGSVFCKWLKWHWLERKSWVFNNQVHAVCKLCGVIVSRPTQRAADVCSACGSVLVNGVCDNGGCAQWQVRR